VGKEKRVKLIKQVILMQEFEEALEALLKIGPSGLESVSWYVNEKSLSILMFLDKKNYNVFLRCKKGKSRSILEQK